jgi:3-deoxy-D-manno-octulosonate 8-phosphate phosphatase (KDO 8-P phosphatase)
MALLTKDRFLKRIKNVRLVALDVDGVFTDDSIYIGPDGVEFKRFDVTDGLAIRLLTKLDIQTGVISARYSAATVSRMTELKIPHIYQSYDKVGCFKEMLKKAGVASDETIFMGNDILDIDVMLEAGSRVCPANAVKEVVAISHFRTKRKGGDGAVRELYELVAASRGKRLVELMRL